LPPALSFTLDRNADNPDLLRLIETCFPSDFESRLVDKIKRSGSTYLSVLMHADDRLAGQVFFSPVTVAGVDESADNDGGAGLGPMCIHPDFQRQRLGLSLLRESLSFAREQGWRWVVVLGHPEFYPLAGFTPASRFGLSCPYPAPDEAFMALELAPGALDNVRGMVSYHPAFDEG
jgi:putative acetyltransferase